MKNLFFITFLLVTSLGFAQKNVKLESFKALDSKVGAEIHLVKSSEYRMEISGKAEEMELLDYYMDDESFKLRSKDTGNVLSNLKITLYVPSLKVIAITNGTRLSMDGAFDGTDNLVISVTKGARADLSDISFSNIVANLEDEDDLKYKSVDNLVMSTSNKDHGRLIKINEYR